MHNISQKRKIWVICCYVICVVNGVPRNNGLMINVLHVDVFNLT